jgi:hypothetical protein
MLDLEVTWKHPLILKEYCSKREFRGETSWHSVKMKDLRIKIRNNQAQVHTATLITGTKRHTISSFWMCHCLHTLQILHSFCDLLQQRLGVRICTPIHQSLLVCYIFCIRIISSHTTLHISICLLSFCGCKSRYSTSINIWRLLHHIFFLHNAFRIKRVACR